MASTYPQYESTYNIWHSKFTANHFNSTYASLSSTKILEYKTSSKIGDLSWNCTAKNFVLNWQWLDKNMYCCMDGGCHPLPPSHSSNGVAQIILQTAYHTLEELWQVKATAKMLNA